MRPTKVGRALKKRKADPSITARDRGNDKPVSQSTLACGVILMTAESSTMARKSGAVPKKRKVESDNTAEDREKEKAVTEARQRRKNGKLAVLLDLPIDVLYEIFGHLRPYDLLRLARVTKEFRRLLMAKSARSVWKTVLDNVPGLPPCPPDMSEPQWVNLAFDPHCHFCFTTGVRNVEWRFRMRICGKCAKEKMEDISIPLTRSPGDLDGSHFAIETMIPSRTSKRLRRSFLKAEYLDIRHEYNALETVEARKKYVQEKQKSMTEIEKHSILCENWSQNQTDDRSLELNALRQERRLAIIKKLEDLGWGPDIVAIRYPDALEDHELVKKPKRLTDRIWSKIQGPIIQFMEKMRAKRLAREHARLVLQRTHIAAKVLQTYKNARLPVTEILPEVMDFCEFPPIKAVLEQPTEVTVDEASFSEALELVPDLIKEWQNDITQQLIRNMRKQGQDARFRSSMFLPFYGFDDDDDCFGYDADDEDIPSNSEELRTKLTLATTAFECKRCIGNISAGSDYDDFLDQLAMPVTSSRPLFFPRVLGHLCLTRAVELPWVWAVNPVESAARLDNPRRTRIKWSVAPLALNQCLSRCVASIVDAAGMNPATTTVDEMNALNVSFACLHCADPNDEEEFSAPCFGWQDAAIHHTRFHTGDDYDWEILDAESRDAGLVGEPIPAPYTQDKSWCCAHCRDLTSERDPDELSAVKDHLASRHNIADGEINRDYYRSYAAEPMSYEYGVYLPTDILV